MQRNNRTWVGAALGMMILILDTRIAIEAAREGVQLCIQTLIPSLFPFFVCSSLLTGALSGKSWKLMEPLERLCRIRSGTGSLVIVGFLGGYPSGALCVRQSFDRGELSKEDALRMSAFCNNAGPSFLFGIIAPCFPEPIYGWVLWLIHIAAAIVTAHLTPGCPDFEHIHVQNKTVTLTEALERGIRTMASVCGWVVLFRMILTFLQRWIFWVFPVPVQILFEGMIELTNGCILLHQIENTELRFLLASVLLGLGGICVLLQTKSVFGSLSVIPYILGKLRQTVISAFLCCHIIALCWGKLSPIPIALLDAAILILMVLRRKGRKNVVAFRRNMVYNQFNVQKTR